jgi:outer membrane protein OmpA-like peptidoglycan-associated protein
MKIPLPRYLKVVALSTSIILSAACSISTTQSTGTAMMREKLSALQSESKLAGRVQVEIKKSESPTRISEKPENDKALVESRVFIADYKIETALVIAQNRLLEDQRKGLIARRDTLNADKRNVEMEKQLINLNATKSDRGMMLTLGDFQFETGKSNLKYGASDNLDKLSVFLKKYEDSQLFIDGYTDNVGSEELNLGLSQRRAEAVKAYFLLQGIALDRIVTTGKGENSPVAGNDSALGRQQNRRVEITISYL